MKIDTNTFKISLDKMSESLKTTGDKRYHAGKMAAVSHIPVIAVCLYMLEYHYPNDPQLLLMRDNLIDFYGYTEIVHFDTK